MPTRRASVPASFLVFLASAALLAGLVALLAYDPFRPASAEARGTRLVVFCAAGIKGPVEAVAREYESRTGVEIQLQYGGSNTLLANLQVAGSADLFIPADDSYVVTAREKNLIAETIPLASMRPTLVVPAGNPNSITSLDDLLTRPSRLAHANPEAAAVGKLVTETLKRSGQWDEFRRRIVVTKPTVNDVAADVALGAVDAGVVWDVTVEQVKGLQAVPVAAFDKVAANLSACVTRASQSPTSALRFARYLAARDRGLVAFAEKGFTVVEGDEWDEHPKLTLFAGAMLRPAIDKTVTRFEEREGVEVSRVYNGCGLLVGEMKLGKYPDAFFACDTEFMTQVKDHFGDATTVSGNQLVILVKKGNPHKIAKLRDLGRKPQDGEPRLRVGIGHEKQCAMGVLTQNTLREDRTRDEVMKNVVVQLPSGDMLVNEMLTGSLDVAVAYISNAAGHADRLQAIPIDIPCAFADQPYAVGKSSKHKHLMGRLLRTIRDAESAERFRSFGFTWKAPGATK